jgi:hypothetical protein
LLQILQQVPTGNTRAGGDAMIPEFPKEILDYTGGAGGLGMLIYLAFMGYGKAMASRKEKSNGNGHLAAADRGIMLTSVLRHSEEIKVQLSGIEKTQAVQTEAIRRIEHAHDDLWRTMETHDNRIRGVEIRQGGRNNAA